MQKITVFKNITDTKKPYYVFPQIIYEYIKNGRYKDKIDSIREITDKGERDKLKATLPSICWSGEFTKRANSAIKKHSGLVCVDFDHVNNLTDFKEKICKVRYTYMAFVSPSGDGLKVIIRIPPNIKTHADSCRAITEYFNEETLDEFKDVARVCYISSDPDIYINPNSEVFTTLVKEKVEYEKHYVPGDTITDTKEIYEGLVKWIDKVESYTDGNKHKYLVKLASACLRFGIPEMDCASWLYFDYATKASRVDRKDFDKIVRDVYKNYGHTACTAHFEEKEKPVYTATKKVVKEEIFDIEIGDKDIIYLDNVRQSMFEGFKTGKAKGTTTYFPDFDKHWTWRKKELNFLGGIGNIGKTTMLNNLMVIKAVKEGWKFAVFSPEQDPPDDFYNDLIHTYIGKSTEPYHDNQMSEQEYKQAMDFIEKHFFYIFPESASPTPEYMNTCFETVIKKHKVDCCVIDPFNQLDNDWRKYNRDDLYISEFLSKAKRFAQKHNISYFIAGHPKGNLQKNGQDYEMPNVYDYAGGAMWNNKTDNILCYHRPNATSDPGDTMCYFASQKIKKRKLTGTPGYCEMKFNILENRFEQTNGFNPFSQESPDNKDLNDIPINFHEPQTEANDCPF